MAILPELHVMLIRQFENIIVGHTPESNIGNTAPVVVIVPLVFVRNERERSFRTAVRVGRDDEDSGHQKGNTDTSRGHDCGGRERQEDQEEILSTDSDESLASPAVVETQRDASLMAEV